MIRKGQTASENVWIEKARYYITVEDLWVEEVTAFRYYGALLWEILKGIAVLVSCRPGYPGRWPSDGAADPRPSAPPRQRRTADRTNSGDSPDRASHPRR